MVSDKIALDKSQTKIQNPNTVMRTSVTDLVNFITNAECKWAGHITRMKDQFRYY